MRVDMRNRSEAAGEIACCVPRDEVESADDLQVVASLCELMCDPNRLKIFASLRSGERCVHDIVISVGLHQNLVSHHLSVLREAGLVRTRRDGHWVCYSVCRDRLAAVYPALKRVFDPGRVFDLLDRERRIAATEQKPTKHRAG